MNAERKIDLDKAIEKVVRGEFSDADIEAVYSFNDVDEDGDPIMRITIVFKSAREFDARKAKSLTHHLFPVLKKVDRCVFPIVSFLSKADHKRVSATA